MMARVSAHTPGAGWAYRLIVLLALPAFLIPLIGYAYTGSFSRYWADDYCYNAALRIDGFWKSQVTFYQTTSDRYAVIPLVGLSELFGRAAIRFWPATAILLGLVGLTWLFKQAGRAAGTTLGLPERLLLAALILFFTFWQAPNLFQVLYWRTGMLTYFMPLVFGIFLAGLALRQWRRAETPAWVLLLGLALAFIAGGFSETTAALQAGALGLAALLVWAARGLKAGDARRARAALALIGASLVGTLLAMALLFLSPSNQLRLVNMPEPAPWQVLLGYSFRYGFDFIRDTFSSQPLPSLVSLLASFALGLAWNARREDTQSPRIALGWLAADLIAMYLLIVCVCAPSVYVEVAYPEARALIAARLVMTLGLAGAGWAGSLAAAGLARGLRVPPKLSLVVGLLLVVVTALYPLRAARTIVLTDLPYYRQRAAGWDARDAEILHLAQRGQTQVAVPALDSIAGLMELQPEAQTFPNTCVAGAYGLAEITGVIK